MAYTLISFIGTGNKTEKSPIGYNETNYRFPDGQSFKTRYFMQAVLKVKDNIDQLILLGTDTSSWDYLVDAENDERNETVSLWSDLYDQCESKEKGGVPIGITQGNLERLEKYLTERFGIAVVLRMHTHKVDDDSSKELFDCYTGITELVKKNNNILFDITHGFRSMPVLLYQALQYSVSKRSRDVEIIYGELDQSKTNGHARSLSSYWEYSALSGALDVFESKLDGFRLADLIADTWEKGSKAIKRLSEIVQTNFALQIFDVVRQIENAVNAYPESAPKHLAKVKDVLLQIKQLIDENNKPRSLYRYSEFLYAHKLNVQAVITLQIAVETAIAIRCGNEEAIGNYDWWQNVGSKKLYDLKGNDWKNIGNSLTHLEGFRNQIAHGGSKNKDTGGFPQAANIPNIYESGKRGVENLFKELGI